MVEGQTKTTLVLLAGFAGAGKTTLATWLGERVGFPCVSKDTIKLAYLEKGVAPEEAGWKSYVDTIALTRALCFEMGESLIVYREILDDIKKTGSRVQVKIVLCVAPKEIRAERIKMRGSVFGVFEPELPEVLSDEEIPRLFGHLFPRDELFWNFLPCLITDKALLTTFLDFSCENVMVMNTTTLDYQRYRWLWMRLLSFLYYG